MGSITKKPLVVQQPVPPPTSAELEKLCRSIRGENPCVTSSAKRPQGNAPEGSMPTFRRFFAWLLGFVPGKSKISKGVKIARRHPGLSAWLVVFAAVGTLIGTEHSSTPRPHTDPQRYSRWLQKRGTSAVQAALSQIGPGVEVDSVRARSANPWILGTYSWHSNEVTFNSNLEYRQTELLEVASHEAVHAIFDQHRLYPRSSAQNDYFTLVNETAAYVLGAHIAGDAWRRQGHNGRELTDTLIFMHELACDPAIPNSMYSHYLAPGRPGSGDFDHEMWRGVLVHFAPLRLVNAVDSICCRESNPVAAAREISRRFMRQDLDPRDRPILAEFEQRKRLWADENGDNS